LFYTFLFLAQFMPNHQISLYFIENQILASKIKTIVVLWKSVELHNM